MAKITHLYNLLGIMTMMLFRPLCLKLSKMTGYINKHDNKKNNNNVS